MYVVSNMCVLRVMLCMYTKILCVCISELMICVHPDLLRMYIEGAPLCTFVLRGFHVVCMCGKSSRVCMYLIGQCYGSMYLRMYVCT